jgi:hypothetical protein
LPYDLVGELFNVDEDSENDLQGFYHVVFSERHVTSDFILVPEVTYTNITIYGDHVVDDYDTYKRRNGKDYSVQRYYGYETVDILEYEIYGMTKPTPYHILPYDIHDAEKFYNGVQTFTAVDMKSPVILSGIRTLPANS